MSPSKGKAKGKVTCWRKPLGIGEGGQGSRVFHRIVLEYLQKSHLGRWCKYRFLGPIP